MTTTPDAIDAMIQEALAPYRRYLGREAIARLEAERWEAALALAKLEAVAASNREGGHG
jgi:hypothetical protein